MISIYKAEGDRRAYLPLLLLADEQESMVERYIDLGDLWLLNDGPCVVGECLVCDAGEGILELKSLAIDTAHQGKGYARALLQWLSAHYVGQYEIVQVGTGESPRTLPFYEHVGFVRHHVVEDFFTHNYDHPIFEDGVLLKDMVYLQKPLEARCHCEA